MAATRTQSALFADPRTRRKIQMQDEGKDRYSVASLVSSKLLLVASLAATKLWLLDRQVAAMPLATAELAVGACITLVTAAVDGRAPFDFVSAMRSEGPVLATASVLQLMQHATLFLVLSRLSLVRTLALTQFSHLLLGSINRPSSTRRALASLLAVAVSFTLDIPFNSSTRDAVSTHACLLAHAVVCAGLLESQGALIPKLGRASTHRATLTGAVIAGLLFTAATKLTGSDIGLPSAIPLLSFWPVLPLAASTALFSPIVATRLGLAPLTTHSFTVSTVATTLFAYIASSIARGLGFHVADIAVVGLVAYGTFPSAYIPSQSGSTAHLLRSYLKTIIANPESRKIFYFLMLNMCFMLVQMLYGVWTNSLGLISDAIHMAFDCMAIGMGLMASVMATWAPNEKFTYGYGRIETLSGFANGIFLLLISVFIVFEAIQRLLDPPEMNTNQLLLVSSMGLGVNLFGMDTGTRMGMITGTRMDTRTRILILILMRTTMGTRILTRMATRTRTHTITRMSTTIRTQTAVTPAHPRALTHILPRIPATIIPTRTIMHTLTPTRILIMIICMQTMTMTMIAMVTTMTIAIHTRMCTTKSASMSMSMSTSTSTRTPMGMDMLMSTITIKGMITSLYATLHHPVVLPEPPTVLVTSPLTPVAHYDTHYAAHHAHRPHTPNAHSHDHHHHAHEHEGHSHNMRGVFLHVMADTLGSVGVIISTLLIQFYGWTGFDPIASIFIAVLIAASVVPLVMDCARVLSLDVGEEREKDVKNALAELQAVEGVAGFTAPRFWPKDQEKIVGAIHIQLSPAGALSATSVAPTYANIDKVMSRVDALLREKIPGLEELTIQVMAPT
ncbi:cation efflux protein [Auricularia subglabra TFB-10046 SS5]|nr:cation efflux protein [Auricularia subglabra TFB-10046 SS5]